MNENEIGVNATNSERAIVCETGTIIGRQVYNVPGSDEQRHRNNQFLAGGYDDFGAVHFGTQFEVNESRFIVKSLSAPFSPTNAATANISPTDFFQENTFIEELPACNENAECGLRRAPTTSEVLENARSLAIRSDFVESPYSEMLNWESKRYLLNLIEQHPNLLNQATEINTYYDAERNSDAFDLIKLKQGWREISAYRDLEIDNLNTLSLQLIEEINTLREAYQNTISETEKESLKASIKSNMLEFQELQTQVSSLKDSIQTLIQNRLVSINFDNTLINNSNLISSNEKLVNSIYLSALLNEDSSLSEIQEQALFEVANQCPKIGGRSVYKARTLYNLLVEYTVFEDSELCLETVEERSLVEQDNGVNATTLQMFVYPNPSYESFNVELNYIDSQNEVILKIYDLTGRLVKIQVLDQLVTSISSDDLSNGVYVCGLHVNNIRTGTRKVVVLNNK
ncbi:MAG: T9SS type A sorting domain-containing protein [Bacteroidota bacterium]